MYILNTLNTVLTKRKNTLDNVNQEVVMDSCPQMWSILEYKYSLKFWGHTLEYETITLIYDNEVKKWIVKFYNSTKNKIKMKVYIKKEDAQTFIRGRKRRLKNKCEKININKKEGETKAELRIEEMSGIDAGD